MNAIAVLDDREETRQTVMNTVRRVLGSPEWEVVEAPLSDTPGAVASWLVDKGVRVLIADQVLNEQSVPGTPPVNYKGHDVIVETRGRLPDLPIYLLTAHMDDADIPLHFGKIEAVIHRGEFGVQAAAWVERMKRAGEAFVERNRTALCRLGELSKKKAGSQLTPAEAEELSAIQATLELKMPDNGRAKVLREVETQLGRLGDLQHKVEALVKGKKK